MAGYWPSSFFACLWTDTKLTMTRGSVFKTFLKEMYFVCNRTRMRGALESHCVLILKWKFLSSTYLIFFRWAVLLLMQHYCNNIHEKYSAR